MTILCTFTFRGRTLEISELPVNTGAVSVWPGAGQGSSAGIWAPGAAQVSIHTLQAVARRGASGVRVALSGMVEGGPIAGIAAELLLYHEEQSRAYGPVHTQYLAASAYREAAGKRIPVWETPLAVRASLPAGLRLISDGNNSSLARLAPVQLGAVGPRLETQTSGEYAPAGGEAIRRAKAVFGPDRRLKALLVYAPQGPAQTPRDTQPGPGDRFTPTMRVFEIRPDFRAGPERQAMGNDLFLGTQALHWYAAPMMPGEYLVGLAVTDLDGGVQRAFTPLSLG